ncbi:MAG TPA: VOC family protein [Acidimicrobiia bacterium]|nr:VOC family protein [Acidimicrobiia bacterium]
MALATYKDLIIDASDARRSGTFWAAALGLRLEENGPIDVVLRGRTPAHTVWVDQVPSPKTVKNRVHIDVHTGDLAALTAAGATVLNDSDFRWVVMADPEGQEFCAFVRERPPDDLLHEIIVDCADPAATAAWWGTVFGVPAVPSEDKTWFSLAGLPGTSFDGLSFVPVPEPKTVKNRVHWDVTGSVSALLDAGARLIRPMTEDPEPDRDWDVLADPGGNEFCVFPERTPS